MCGQPAPGPLHERGTCHCHGHAGMVPRDGFIQPCLLLLLLEKPAHGYELLDRLNDFGLAEADPGGIYRNLKRLEEDGLVESSWETEGSGPARKEYRVTAEGEDFLHAWARILERRRDHLNRFLDRYREYFAAKGGES